MEEILSQCNGIMNSIKGKKNDKDLDIKQDQQDHNDDGKKRTYEEFEELNNNENNENPKKRQRLDNSAITDHSAADVTNLSNISGQSNHL